MEVKDFTQLEEFLFKKKQRFVDIFLWELHLDRIVDKTNSVGLDNDINACVHSLKGRYTLFEHAKTNIERYIKICNQKLVPEEYIDWLDKKDLRQCNFVWLTLKNRGLFKEKTLNAIKGNSDKYYLIIRALDLHPKNMPEKLNIIKDIRVAWLQTINYKGWRHDWLDMYNKSQCQNALEFLTTKVSVKVKKHYLKPPLADDDNELSYYYKFLASVDIWSTFPTVKQYFYKSITDASRKWRTPEQKKAQVKLKSKAKENNHILLKDKKSLELLKSIQEKMEHKTPDETLKYIINEQVKRTDFVETDEIITLKLAQNDKEDANKPSKVQLNEKQELNDDLEKPNKIEVSKASMKKTFKEVLEENIPKEFTSLPKNI